MGQLHLYITSSQGRPPQLDQLIQDLGMASPDETVILVANADLKRHLCRKWASAAVLQRMPNIVTLDEWLMSAIGVTSNRGPVVEAAARQLFLHSFPSSRTLEFLKMNGIWSRFSHLAATAKAYQIPPVIVNDIARDWIPFERESSPIDILQRIANARDQVGIRDSQDAVASVLNLQIHTVIALGFQSPLPKEQDQLMAIIRRSTLTIVPISITDRPSPLTTQWLSRLRAHPTVQETRVEMPTRLPDVTVWTAPTESDEVDLIAGIVRRAVNDQGFALTDIGIALANFEQDAGWMVRELNARGVPTEIPDSVPLLETVPGRLTMAFVTALRSALRFDHAMAWCKLRLESPVVPEYSIQDVIDLKNVLISRGIFDVERWWTRIEPLSLPPALWNEIQRLVSVAGNLYSLSQELYELNHPNIGGWTLAGMMEWGQVFQVITQWRALFPIVSDTGARLSILQDALRMTRCVRRLDSGIRICSLDHAMTISEKIWIVPRVTDRAWPGHRNALELPQARLRQFGLPDTDAMTAAHETGLELVMGHTDCEVHMTYSAMIDTEPQLVSGVAMSVLHRRSIPFQNAEYRPASARGPVNGPPPTMPDPVLISELPPFSASKLSDYQACPRYYWLTHILKLGTPPAKDWDLAPNERGSLLHLLVGQLLIHLQSGRHAEEWMESVAPSLIAEFRAGKPGKMILSRLVGTQEFPGLLRRLCDEFTRFVNEYEVLDVERRFEFELAPAVIRGAIDLVVRHRETGLMVVVDIKTGSTPITKIHLERFEHLQLPIYWLALRQEGSAADAGMIWNITTKSERKLVMVTEAGQVLVPKRQQPFRLTVDTDGALVDRLFWIITQIQAGDFRVTGIPELERQESARVTEKCPHCEFRLGCPFPKRFG